MEITPRIRQLLRFLLEQPEYVREQELADAVGSSKRTIQRELQYLSGELGQWQLELERKKGVGLRLTGTPEAVAARAMQFRLDMMLRDDWAHTVVVSHWGFILAMTGRSLVNGEWLRCDPTGPEPENVVWHHG